MADFKVGALFETNAPQVARDVNRVADSMDNVGTAATQATRGTDQMTLSQQKLALANQKVVSTADSLNRMHRLGTTSGEQYNRVLAQNLRAQQAVLTETAKIERLQTRTAGRSGIGSGGIGGAVVGGVAGYVTGQAVSRYLLDSRDAAVSLNTSVEKSRVLFGGASGAVERFGKTANTEIGASRQAAIEAAAGFGTLFKAAGVGDKDIARLSIGFTKLSADLAAYHHDADATGADHALQQAMHGQYDTLAQYGIVLTTADVKQKAFQLGLIHTVKDALTPAATAQAVYALAIQKAGVQTGAFSRISGEAAGKQQILAASSENAKASIGQGLVPVMNDLTDIAQKDLLPVLDATGKALGFLGGHDTIRHLGELGVAMLILRAGVNLLKSSYDRLAVSAGRAAVAEEAAATAGGGRIPGVGKTAGLIARVGGLGPSAVITGSALAIGALGIEATRGSERERLARGAAARGHGSFDYYSRAFGQGLLHHLPGGGYLDRFTGYDADLAAADRADQQAQHLALLEARRQDPRVQSNPAFLAASARQDRAAATQAAAAYKVRQARAYLDSRGYVQDAGSVPLGGLLDALPEKPDQSAVQNARDAYRSAQAGVAIAQARAAQARRGTGGSSAGSIASAQAAVLTAQDAVRRRGGNAEAEALRLQAAEERLAQAKAGGTTNTLGLMTAEKSLADARRHQASTAAALHKAEKEASGDKSLTLKEVLDRATHSATTASGESANVKTLVAKGLTQPVIAELEGLEQTAPGTIAKVAKGLTPAYVAQLNKDAKTRTQAALDIARLGGIANLNALEKEAAAAGNKLAKATTDAYAAALKDPGWQSGALGEFLRQQAGLPPTPTPTAPPAVAAGAVPPPAKPHTAPATHAKTAAGGDRSPIQLLLSDPKSDIIRGVASADIAHADRIAAQGIGTQG